MTRALASCHARLAVGRPVSRQWRLDQWTRGAGAFVRSTYPSKPLWLDNRRRRQRFRRRRRRRADGNARKTVSADSGGRDRGGGDRRGMLRLEGIRMMASVSRKGIAVSAIGPCSTLKALFMPNQQPIVVLFEDKAYQVAISFSNGYGLMHVGCVTWDKHLYSRLNDSICELMTDDGQRGVACSMRTLSSNVTHVRVRGFLHRSVGHIISMLQQIFC